MQNEIQLCCFLLLVVCKFSQFHINQSSCLSFSVSPGTEHALLILRLSNESDCGSSPVLLVRTERDLYRDKLKSVENSCKGSGKSSSIGGDLNGLELVL